MKQTLAVGNNRHESSRMRQVMPHASCQGLFLTSNFQYMLIQHLIHPDVRYSTLYIKLLLIQEVLRQSRYLYLFNDKQFFFFPETLESHSQAEQTNSVFSFRYFLRSQRGWNGNERWQTIAHMQYWWQFPKPPQQTAPHCTTAEPKQWFAFQKQQAKYFRNYYSLFLFLPISPLLLMFLLQLPDTQQTLSCHTLWIQRKDKQLAESKRGLGVSSSSCWVTSVCSVAEVLFWAQCHRWKLIKQCGEEKWGEEAIGVSREQGLLIGVCDYTGCC